MAATPSTRPAPPRWLGFLGLFITALSLGACSEGVLAPAGPVASTENQILFETFGAMMLVVVPVILMILAFAWWFRASNRRARYLPDWSYSGKIEFSIWIIPLLLIVFLATLAWSGSHDLDPYRPLKSDRRPVRIDVVSLEWKWLFVYPDYGVASVNEMAIPTGTPIELHLTSGTVMNSFFIPQLGSQIYTMAGMQTRLALQADRPGTYRGLSAQFSGDGFSDMNFTVRAGAGASFAQWIAQAKASPARLDAGAYDRLAGQHAKSPPTLYGRVDPDVFQHAVMAATATPASANAAALKPLAMQGTF